MRPLASTTTERFFCANFPLITNHLMKSYTGHGWISRERLSLGRSSEFFSLRFFFQFHDAVVVGLDDEIVVALSLSFSHRGSSPLLSLLYYSSTTPLRRGLEIDFCGLAHLRYRTRGEIAELRRGECLGRGGGVAHACRTRKAVSSTPETLLRLTTPLFVLSLSSLQTTTKKQNHHHNHAFDCSSPFSAAAMQIFGGGGAVNNSNGAEAASNALRVESAPAPCLTLPAAAAAPPPAAAAAAPPSRSLGKPPRKSASSGARSRSGARTSGQRKLPAAGVGTGEEEALPLGNGGAPAATAAARAASAPNPSAAVPGAAAFERPPASKRPRVSAATKKAAAAAAAAANANASANNMRNNPAAAAAVAASPLDDVERQLIAYVRGLTLGSDPASRQRCSAQSDGGLRLAIRDALYRLSRNAQARSAAAAAAAASSSALAGNINGNNGSNHLVAAASLSHAARTADRIVAAMLFSPPPAMPSAAAAAAAAARGVGGGGAQAVFAC